MAFSDDGVVVLEGGEIGTKWIFEYSGFNMSLVEKFLKLVLMREGLEDILF